MIREIEPLQDVLRVELLPNGRWVELIDDVRFEIDGEIVNVPVGFKTDFKSTPRIFWSIVPPFGLGSVAAVIHDWLYNDEVYKQSYTRKEADEIFYWLMRYYGVGKLKASLMYYMVRLFGKRAYSQ